MRAQSSDVAESVSVAQIELLPKEQTILDRSFMAFRPFGLDEQGLTIRDLSGMSIRAVILDLEKTLTRERGEGAGVEAVHELCALLNQRIKDSVYHVTPEFLKNPWNSYSYEFAAYLYEFCEQLTGDPNFIFAGGMEKMSPIIQVLARPFSLEQIYGMFPYFGNKFASGSVECRVVEVTPGSATLAMRFADRTLRQFGPFRRRCTYLVCQSAQGIFAAVPARVHGLPPATLTNLSCVSNDDEWCRWLIRWQSDGGVRWGRPSKPVAALPVQADSAPRDVAPAEPGSFPGEATGAKPGFSHHLSWLLWSGLIGGALAGGLCLLIPSMVPGEIALAGLMPVLATGLLIQHRMSRDSQQREALIREQIAFVESRHEELREAYLGQEQTRVELRRKVTQLTALHQAGLLFSATFDRDMLLQRVLETLTRDLHYDRAMVSTFDPLRSVIRHVRVIGASDEVLVYVQSCEVPVTDRHSPEGRVVLQGLPLLIQDIRSVWQDLHPANRRLAELSGTKSLIVVPLKAKDHILGTLMVDRTYEHSLTKDDLELMTTLASQVAIALDNAAAYQQIEEWNAGLELKIRERTQALEQADRLRSQFLSHVSHELKTPLTSIKGFVQNLLDGLTGPMNDKQQRYLSRMLDNSDRLIRMIDDLLDRTRIETGRLEIRPVDVDLESCLTDAIEQLRPLASAKRQRLELFVPAAGVVVSRTKRCLPALWSNQSSSVWRVGWNAPVAGVCACAALANDALKGVTLGEGKPSQACSIYGGDRAPRILNLRQRVFDFLDALRHRFHIAAFLGDVDLFLDQFGNFLGCGVAGLAQPLGLFLSLAARILLGLKLPLGRIDKLLKSRGLVICAPVLDYALALGVKPIGKTAPILGWVALS